MHSEWQRDDYTLTDDKTRLDLDAVCSLLHTTYWATARPREVIAKCRFLIYRNRVETETDLLVGKREDTLRHTDDGWLIARRKIILDQNVLLTKNLTFFF